jgi:ankyrin repeat protein
MSIAKFRERERQEMEAVRVRNESAEFHSAEEFLERQSLLVLPGRGGGRKLRHACQHGKLEEARELLACGCQPTSTDEAFERTALHWAAWSGDVEVGELLFTHPSTMSIVDAQDHSNLTALHLAAERGHTNFIELLMRKRADPLLRATGGNTPLHYAAFNNHSGAASFILRKLILMNMVNEPTLNNMRNRDRLAPIELAESRGHSHLASTLTDIIALSTSEDERFRLLNNEHRHRSEMQTAYLESTHKSIAENLASRSVSPLLFPRAHEGSPELASQHLRSSFAAHAARRPQPQRASSPVPWK